VATPRMGSATWGAAPQVSMRMAPGRTQRVPPQLIPGQAIALGTPHQNPWVITGLVKAACFFLRSHAGMALGAALFGRAQMMGMLVAEGQMTPMRGCERGRCRRATSLRRWMRGMPWLLPILGVPRGSFLVRLRGWPVPGLGRLATP
jgi:hypothetical protein